ncbi:MAG TPA: Rieske 2Fe-2S domain-containing protein [Trebonia sp.]
MTETADWLVAPELAPDPADPVMAPLYEAAARGALALPFCAACSTPLELEQYVCDVCGASAETGTAGRQWRDVQLAGTVHAATLVHRREPGLIVATGPYPVIDVELASGHRLVLTTATMSGEAPAVGATVTIAFRTVGAVKLPAVRLSQGRTAGRMLRQETNAMTVTDQAGSPAETAAGLRPGDVRALVQPDRVRGLVYTDPLVYDLEVRRIFREGWVFVAHESEVPEPGDYVTKRIAGEPYVVARGKDGEVRVLANRCTHRGNRLCNADKGNSSSFRCPYHGWTFSNDGSLSGVPMRDGYAERFGEIRASLGLVRASRQESYGGFVFASLEPEGITLEEHLGNARHAIDRLVALSPTGGVQLTAGWMKHRMYCNWKMVMENNVDGYHALFTHQSVYDAVRPAKVSHVPSKTETMVRDMGNGHSEIDYASEYRRLDEEFVWYGRLKREKVPGYIAALEEARGVDGAHDTLVIGPPHTLIFPNLFIAEMNIMTVEPLSVGETIAYTSPVLIPGQPELNSRTLRRTEGAMGPAGFLIADDGEIGARNQLGLAAREPEWVTLSRGLESDTQDATGRVNRDKSAETPQRGWWRHWAGVLEGETPGSTVVPGSEG